jgi:hypothetical protein
MDIFELDQIVTTLEVHDCPLWVSDYIAMMNRRRRDWDRIKEMA